MANCRTNITIVGVGERKSGTSKNTGKAYDFVPVSFTFEDPYESTCGVLASTHAIPGKDFEKNPVYVGDVHDAFLTQYKGQWQIGAIL